MTLFFEPYIVYWIHFNRAFISSLSESEGKDDTDYVSQKMKDRRKVSGQEIVEVMLR